jgi:hypothetical protein
MTVVYPAHHTTDGVNVGTSWVLVITCSNQSATEWRNVLINDTDFIVIIYDACSAPAYFIHSNACCTTLPSSCLK